MIFQILGIIAALAACGYIAAAGWMMNSVSLGFSGKVDVISVFLFLAGVAGFLLTIYYSPFSISFKESP